MRSAPTSTFSSTGSFTGHSLAVGGPTESASVPTAAGNSAADRAPTPAGWPTAVHPAATLFPMLHGAQLGELAADIEHNGLREPIVVYQGLLLDGRNRLRGCDLAHVEPRFVEWDGQGSVVSFVLSRNLHRRHLSESQRAIVAARAKSMFEEEAAERIAAGQFRPRSELNTTEGVDGQKRHDSTAFANLQKPPVHAHTQAAALLNVSPRSVATASRVLARGEAEVVSAVESGSIAVSDAAAVVGLPADEQREAVERVKSGKARTLRQAVGRGRRAKGGGEAPADAADADSIVRRECQKFGPEASRLLRRAETIARAGGANVVTDRLIAAVNHVLRIFNDGLASLTQPKSGAK
jgi:ParB-like chromosome segregation protein Spo0J